MKRKKMKPWEKHGVGLFWNEEEIHEREMREENHQKEERTRLGE
jgi:hypothetical protein